MVLKPVQELAGLLCYTDPVSQAKGKDVSQFLTKETRKCMIDSIIVAISTSDMQTKARSSKVLSGSTKLSQMIKQIQVTQEMLIESRQN